MPPGQLTSSLAHICPCSLSVSEHLMHVWPRTLSCIQCFHTYVCIQFGYFLLLTCFMSDYYTSQKKTLRGEKSSFLPYITNQVYQTQIRGPSPRLTPKIDPRIPVETIFLFPPCHPPRNAGRGSGWEKLVLGLSSAMNITLDPKRQAV